MTKWSLIKPEAAERREHGLVGAFFANLGPGLITGAADDDPSGISTYSVAGAAIGYSDPLDRAVFISPDGGRATDVRAAWYGNRSRTRRRDPQTLSTAGCCGRRAFCWS